MSLEDRTKEVATLAPKRILLLDDCCFDSYRLRSPLYWSPSLKSVNIFQKALGIRFVYEKEFPWYSINYPGTEGKDSFEEYATLLKRSSWRGRVFADISRQFEKNPLFLRDVRKGYYHSFELESRTSNFSLHKLYWIRQMTQYGDIDGKVDYVAIGHDYKRGIIKAAAVAPNMRKDKTCILRSGYDRINEALYRQLGYNTFMVNRDFRAYLRSLQP